MERGRVRIGREQVLDEKRRSNSTIEFVVSPDFARLPGFTLLVRIRS